METKRLTAEQMDEAVELLKKGEVVAFPTDTVYGAGVRYDSSEAILKLKTAKQRPESKPFSMMVSSLDQIAQVAYISEKAEKLIKAFMPGAITLIFNKLETVDDEVTNGFKTIGIRMPDDKWVTEMISKVGVALLVPSANISGEPATHTSDEVLAQLDGRIAACVLGQSGGQLASTIVNVSEDDYKILRQGPISEEEISKVWNS